MKTLPTHGPTLSVLIACMALALPTPQAADASVTLVDDGEARVSVVVADEALETDPEGDLRGLRGAVDRAPSEEVRQRVLHLAALDVAEYLERLSGAPVEVADEPIDGLLPIHVAPLEDAPETIELGVSSEFGDAYAIDVSDERIILTGESERAAHYAAARMLHHLGVRWYAPGEIGEHVPQSSTLTLDAGRIESAPDFQTRNLWPRSAEEQRWMLRNRMGGPRMPQGHAFSRYQRPIGGGDRGEFFEENPDFFPIVGGEPHSRQANLSNPDVVEHFAEHIRHIFENDPDRWTAGIGPDDGPIIDERPETQGIIAGRREPLMQRPEATDLFVRFANRVAERLEDDYPDALLGFYVYSNHAMVPEDEPPHEMLFPVVAPITFTRYASVDNPAVPTSMLLADIVKQWAELSPRIGFYLYNFNLADTAMPFTRTLAFGKSIPKYYEWGLRYASIESMTNWHTMVPGNYVTGKLLWDVETDYQAVADEVYADYFGPAAEPMRRYNHLLERAYESTDAHSGNLWSMHRILGPIMGELESAMSEAEAAAEGEEPYASRVEVLRYGLNFAEHWLGARDALNAFELEEAADHADAFLANYEEANEAYPLFFTRMIERYFKAYHHHAFEDARRVAEEGRLIYRFPDTWRAYFDEPGIGHRMGLGDPRSAASNWMDLDTYSATIDEQGFPHFRGVIWYRHTFEMPTPEAAPQTEGLFGPPTDDEDSRIMLWFAGTDGPVHVYLNGENLGSHSVRNFGPAEIDITDAVRAGAENTLIVAVDNTGIIELGTGGIMRPVAIYQTE